MMRWLVPVMREILGLFVDDGRIALSILLWLAAVAVLLRLFLPLSAWAGPMLFAGLAIILVRSCLHQAARRQP